MGINPGNPAFAVPPDEYDGVRRQRDTERSARENAAARSLEASTIGSGGLVVKDGGSIRVEAPGTIDLPGGAFSAATLAASGTVTAGGTISTPGNVVGGGLVSTGTAAITGGMTVGGVLGAGGVSSSGDVGIGGALRAMSVYNTTLVSSYRAVWVTSTDGQLGYVPSSERFKQDIEAIAASPELVQVLLHLQVVSYRYKAAVEVLGDDASLEVGLIAERVHELGVYWLVDYEDELTDDGKATPVPFAPERHPVPFGIRYDRVGLAVMLIVQWLAAQHALLAEQHEILASKVARISEHLGMED